MEFTVKQVADMLGGEVEGDPSARIRTAAKIEEAGEGAIAFYANSRYEKYLYETGATAVLVGRDFVPKRAVAASLIRVDDAYTAFARLLSEYQKLTRPPKTGREEPCFVHETARVGEGVYVGAFAYVGANAVVGDGVKLYPRSYVGEGAEIGEGTVLHAGAQVHEGCKVGKGCTLQAGAIVGSDGFGFAPQADGSYESIPQMGNVVLEDRVDIGANAAVDRATLGSTVVGAGSKIDNLVQIAHNVVVGPNTVMAAQSGISGSTQVGARCMIGGQVGISGHISVADGTSLAAQTGVHRAIEEPGKAWMGSPVMPKGEYVRSSIVFQKLPEMLRRLEELERRLEEKDS